MPQVPSVAWFSVRKVAVSGFEPDANWESTNDIVAWRVISKPNYYAPRRNGAGLLQLSVTFYTNANVVVPALSNSRVDVQFISLRSIVNLMAGDELVERSREIHIAGDAEFELIHRFPDEIGVRMLTLQEVPPGADMVSVNVRIV